MTQVELYNQLKAVAVQHSHFFGRKLIIIPREAFMQYEEYFQLSFNILNRKNNFRSKATFRHIHAIENGMYVEFHFDYSNPDKGIVYLIPHTILDVVPYFLYFFCTLRRPYSFEPTN